MTTLPDYFPGARPSGPRFPLTPGQRARGMRLAMIHRLHLQQLDEVKAVILAIDGGLAAPQELEAPVDGLTLTRNLRVFGTLCGQECQVLTFHHSAEDAEIFPALRVGDAALTRVLDRLAEEHLVIHDGIEALARELQAFRQDPGHYGTLRATFLGLDRLVRSHFGYEEVELADAIGHYGAPL